VNKISKRFLIMAGVSAAFVAVIAVFIFLISPISIRLTDTKIVQILYENEASLLNIEGVVGAGIVRNENNHIVGIAVYVEDNISGGQKRKIPSELNGFKVIIKKVSETS
jgi:hypothetical protein